MTWVVRVLGIEVLRVEHLDEPGTDRGDSVVAHVIGFAPSVVEVREPLPDREV